MVRFPFPPPPPLLTSIILLACWSTYKSGPHERPWVGCTPKVPGNDLPHLHHAELTGGILEAHESYPGWINAEAPQPPQPGTLRAIIPERRCELQNPRLLEARLPPDGESARGR
jgi:hypothetical protein